MKVKSWFSLEVQNVGILYHKSCAFVPLVYSTSKTIQLKTTNCSLGVDILILVHDPQHNSHHLCLEINPIWLKVIFLVGMLKIQNEFKHIYFELNPTHSNVTYFLLSGLLDCWQVSQFKKIKQSLAASILFRKKQKKQRSPMKQKNISNVGSGQFVI